MRGSMRWLVVGVGAGVLLLGGCGERRVSVAGDGGGASGADRGTDGDGPRLPDMRPLKRDRGVTPTPEWGVPHDLRPTRDQALKPDRQVLPLDLGTKCRPMGYPCSSDQDCCSKLGCATIYTGAKVCTQACTQDDPSTPLVNEDTCPQAGTSRFICANLAAAPGQNLRCLQRCTPTAGKNTCAPGLACAVKSTWITFSVDKAVCGFTACKTGKDCPVMLQPLCVPGGPATYCKGLPAGVFCAPHHQGSLGGRCALPGVCDATSGLCAPHNQGKAGARVGDPCNDDRDCSGQMECLQELTTGGISYFRNGYCAIDGCIFASTLPQVSCPAGSTCSRLYSAGRCLKTCDLKKANTCRNNPADKHGDYECRAWHIYVGQPGTVTSAPVCEAGHAVPCTLFNNSKVTCKDLGLSGNPTQMACRDPATGKVLPDGSSGGMCLDTTASGK